MSTPTFVQYGPAIINPAGVTACQSFFTSPPVNVSAPVVTIGLTYSGSGPNALTPGLVAALQFLVDFTNAAGGVWMKGTQYQTAVLLGDDQSSIDYMKLLYARMMELGVQVFITPYGDTFIQSLTPLMRQANATLIAGKASDPADYVENTGNFFSFINTADALLAPILDIVNNATRTYYDEIQRGQVSVDNGYVSPFGLTTMCIYTAITNTLLVVQRQGIVTWMEQENARRRLAGALNAEDFVHTIVDVTWPDNSDANTYATYYNLCSDNVDIVVALADGMGSINGLQVSQLRPKAIVGWSGDDFRGSDLVSISAANGFLIPIPVAFEPFVTVRGQPFANYFDFIFAYESYAAAANISALLSSVMSDYIIQWSGLMSSINASLSLNRSDLASAILSLDGDIMISGPIAFNATTGINTATVSSAIQCLSSGGGTINFIESGSSGPFPFPWAWHKIEAGDVIESAQSSSPILIGLVVAVLGAWVAQIIVEQAIFARRNNSKYEKLWVFVVAMSLGGVGIWASMLMQSTSLTTSLPGLTSSQPIEWSIGIILLALLPSILLTFCGAVTLLHDTADNKVADSESAAAQAAHNVRSQKVAKRKEAALSHLQHFYLLIDSITWRVAVGSLLILAAVILTRITLWYVWQQTADFKSVGWAWAVTVILDAALISSSMLMFFHALRWRIPAVFMFAAAVMSDWQLHATSLVFTYAPAAATTAVNSVNINSTTVLLIAGLIAAFMCFVFIGLQFNAMKLSRNDLTILVLSMEAVIKRLKSKVGACQHIIERQQKGAQILARFVDTIHFITVFPQEYILPLSTQSSIYQLIPTQSDSANVKQADKAHSEHGSVIDGHRETSKIFSSDGNRSSKLSSNHTSERGTEQALLIDAPINSRSNAKTKEIEREYEDGIEAALEALTTTTSVDDDTIAQLSLPLLNGNTAESVVNQSLSLEELLDHPVTVEIFKQELLKTQSAENLIFCLHARRYRTLNSSKARKLLAPHIANAFIRLDAPQQININTRQRETVLNNIDNHQFSSHLFYEAERECIMLMKVNAFKTFNATNKYRLCCYIYHTLDVREAVRALTVDVDMMDNDESNLGWINMNGSGILMSRTGPAEDSKAGEL